MSHLSLPWRPRRWTSAALLVALAASPVLVARTVADPSPWLHLRVGRFLLDGGRFGRPDPWAPFATVPYQPTQWLPSVVVAWAHTWAGDAAVVWARTAAIVLLTAGLYVLARAAARPAVAVVVAALAVAASWSQLTERPQLAGFVLLVPVLLAWWRTGDDLRPRWWLVPLTWVSACTHGVWAIGVGVGALVVLGTALARRGSRSQVLRLVALLVACLVASAVTPLGPRLVLSPLTVGSNGRQFVSEWFPSSVRSPQVLVVLGLLALTYLLWLGSRTRPPAWKLLLVLAAIGFTLSMQRTVPVGAFLAVPLAAEGVEAHLRRRGPADAPSVRAHRPELLALATAVVAALLVAVPVSAGHSGPPHGVPSALQPALQSLPKGTRLISDGDVSGWVLYAAPQVQPVFDLRIEAYAPHYVSRYIDAMDASPGWRSFVAEGQTTTALLPLRSPLALALQEQEHWRVTGRAGGYQLLRAP